jgi:cystathionine beta-lyase/cystathionine gamma-synthase
MSQEHATNWRFSTRAIHVGQEPDPVTGATVPPIHPTSTYTQASPGKHKGYEYSRSSNPTRVNLEMALASLENGTKGACFASGSAATACIFATLSPGDKVLAYGDVYGGTFRLLKRVFEGFGLVPVFTEDCSPQGFSKLIDAKTKIVWIESPTNPLLRCLDISAIARIAHGAGAKLVVDNTFATPVLQLPLDLGADYVVHSTTKYIGGHSDVIGGAIVVKDPALMERIAFLQNAMGGVPGPWDCYLQQRGIKTLSLRMEKHCANGLALAKHMQGHSKLSRVIFPFLEDHPDYALAKRQMCGGGGIVTIVFKGERAAALRFCENLKVFALAESLGGVESLCNHPAIMTHASIPKEIREARGITDGLVRLSVGIEDIEDLKADVDHALAKA